MRLITVFVNSQLDAQFFFLYLFIPFLHMFRATKCWSSGKSIVPIRPLVYVTVCRWPCGMQVWMEYQESQFFFLYLFIPILYMFRATKCSSSGESVVSTQPLVYVTVCRWPCGMHSCIPHGHLHSVAYTRGLIDTIDSPDDEHLVARNM